MEALACLECTMSLSAYIPHFRAHLNNLPTPQMITPFGRNKTNQISITKGYHKESERHTAYPEQRTVHFENVANITVDSDSVFTKNKKNGSDKYC